MDEGRCSPGVGDRVVDASGYQDHGLTARLVVPHISFGYFAYA
jgi:hypothetical protein